MNRGLRAGRWPLALSLTAVTLALGARPAPLSGQQSLARRIASVRNGSVQFEFPARAGVCGDGRSYIRIGDSMIGSFNSSADIANCEPGPVRVRLELSDARIVSLHDYAGPIGAVPPGVTELGMVSAEDGSAYLLGLVESPEGGRVTNRAVLPALLGRDVVAWPTLLRIAKAGHPGRRSRNHDVIFWLAQYAAAKLAGSDDPFYGHESPSGGADENVKEHAVFALSQLRNSEGIEPLIDVARTNRNQRVRARAMFWLGESGDPRAVALFEQVLTTRAPTPRG